MATEKPNAESAAEELQIGQENADGTVEIHDPTEVSQEVQQPQGQQSGTGAEHDDEYDDDDDAGTPLQSDATGGGGDDSSLEQKRQQRRQERQDRKVARRQRDEAVRNELRQAQMVNADLSARLAAIERRTSDSELAQLDVAINRAGQAKGYFSNIIAEATKKQDGNTVADATRRMIEAQNEEERLRRIRESYALQQAPVPQVDPNLQRHATAWMSRNNWYSPGSNDNDSVIARALDNALAAEGRDPRTPEYYAELDRRLRRYLPHRFTGAQDPNYNAADPAERPPRKPAGPSPVAGSGRNDRQGNGGGKGTTFVLSAQRVQALKEAGMWDDPKARADAIRRYREHDRSAANATKSN